MLMMTHTWILKEFLGSDFRDSLDLYVYNVCPDLLPIHKCITSEFTHGISRRYSYDLRLIQETGQMKLYELFSEAVEHTVEKKMDELCTTLDWLFGMETVPIRQALEKGLSSRTLDRMKSLRNIEGRIGFYIDRFGLDRGDDETWKGTRALLLQGMQQVRDHDAFLYPTLHAIKNSGFPCFL